MFYLPQLQRGTGALTAPVLNHLMDAARTSDQQEWTRFKQSDTWKGPILMEIVDSQLMTGETTRWEYNLRQVFLNSSGIPTHNTGMITTEGKDESMFNGFNAAEYCNTATHVQGCALSDLPGTFELKPIADDTLVLAWISGGITGTHGADTKGIIAMFSLQNVICGTCA